MTPSHPALGHPAQPRSGRLLNFVLSLCAYLLLPLAIVFLIGQALGWTEERRFGFDPVNWALICSDYQGGTTPIDSRKIREALILEGWDQKTRDEVKQQCVALGLL